MTEARSFIRSLNPKCGKCGAFMQEGFILDSVEGFHGDQPAMWYAGSPSYGFLGGLKLSGKESYPVLAFRCKGCGSLDLYALPQPA